MNNDEIEDYNNWRKTQGMKLVVPKFKKRLKAFYLSDEAAAGLEVLARNFDVRHGNRVSLSAFIEGIGLMQYIIMEADSKSPGTDGLTEDYCYKLGYDDFITIGTPSFHEDAKVHEQKRDIRFINAYFNGFRDSYNEFYKEAL